MIKSWQFIRDNGTAHGGYVPPSGRKEIYDGVIRLCRAGYHASIRVIDALRYAQGCIIRRVECGGRIIKGQYKLVCTERRELWRIDATNVLHEFACRCAEDALALIDNPDQRALAAIAAKRMWLQNEISSNELAAARASAINAATPAATAADWGVAMAASNAALECPKWAALNAAKAAAWAAAWAVNWHAKWAAASELRAADSSIKWKSRVRRQMVRVVMVVVGVIRSWVKFRAQQKQNRRLTAMLIAEAKKQGDLND